MRLVTLDSREVGGRPGVWLPSGEILDLAAAPGTLDTSRWLPQSVVSVLAQGEEGRARMERLASFISDAPEHDRATWRNAGILLPFGGTQLLAPVRRPGLLLMVRLDALPASGDGIQVTMKNPNAAVGPDSSISLPDARIGRLSAAPMIGLVIGRPLFGGSPAEAARALAAVTLVVDLGLAHWSAGGEAGRQFPGACPLGPAFLTLDELPATTPVPLVFRINGHIVGRQSFTAGSPDLADVVARVSRDYALRPGDILGLQAPAADFTAGRGDRISATLADLMELRFTIA